MGGIVTTEWKRWAEQVRQQLDRQGQERIRQQQIQEGAQWYDKQTREEEEQQEKRNLAQVQTFASGATRNTDTDKYDYEGFLSPEALHAYGEYMHEHRHQRDGSVRDSDNWQRGIPFRTYVKSLVRHTFDLWRMERGFAVINPDTGKPHTKKELCCAIVFNAMGYLKELVDPAPIHRCKTNLTPQVNAPRPGGTF